MAADLVLKNARVITMAATQPTAELVAISGGKIVLVGGSGEVESVTGANTRVIDCLGKTVVPGFIDAHCHVVSFVRKLLSIDLSPSSVRSIDDIKAAIRRQAERTPAGKWLLGTDYNEFYLAEKRCPTRRDIDEVAPNHPVILSHRSLHACVLNTMALSLAGITAETPEPPGGLIDRDLSSGEPSGVLYDMLGYIRDKVVPPLTEGELDEGIALADRQYLSHGITSLHEATVSNDYSRWQNFRRLKTAGRLRSRIYMMLGARARGRFLEAGLASGSGDNGLRLGAVKMMLGEATGQMQPSALELNQQALDSHRAGFQLAFHAVGQGELEAAVTALEYVKEQRPLAGRRHRIEHCSECPPPLLGRLGRLGRLGVVVVTQPPFVYYSGERYLATLSPDRLRWLYRVKSIIDRGLVVAGSSDSPVVPNSPLVGIYAAVSRMAESGQPVLPQESISVSQAMAMYTVNAAHASFEEGIKGVIAPGKLADLAVLSDDPTQVPVEQIKDIRVEMTIIGGKVVWEA